MSKRLPRFRTEREDARFRDTHDSTDYVDEFEDDVDTVFVRPESGIVELSKDMGRDLVRGAKRRKTTPSRLVTRWIRQHLASAG
ncbi:MAG: CopG family antitoxin [Phycisphaerae bacterium]